MGLSDNITITRNQVYKGTSYPVIGSLASFPGELETVINPSTHVLEAGLSALAPTTEDGVTINRVAEVSDGIEIDQKAYNLDEGEPTSWTMEVTMTLLKTDADAIRIAWETAEKVAVSGSIVSQQRVPMGAPTAFTSRELFIIQEDETTGRMRVFAFRDAIPQVDTEINIQSEEAAGLPITFKCRADSTLADHHGPFGFLFEEDA